MENYTEINAKTVDKWVDEGWLWGRPLSARECAEARAGRWDVVLTPCKPVPKDWFPPFPGARILGLASGGGQQMPVFALLGASCVVMDLSDRQLESERLVARREGYAIDVVKADMTKRFPFEDCAFDLIFHPVSNCYVEDVYHVWRECYRVLRPGGILLSGLDNGINYLFDEYARPLTVVNSLPYTPLKNPSLLEKPLKNHDGIQFSHTFDEQIGGQIKAGFVIAGAYEDLNGPCDDGDTQDATRAFGIPAFWATRAIKG
ncbi:MAG: class I SAM-dependent methyltransferase [Treponema sp.]|nr:class I SAM-dependent methyltransferase [Treponema sp.]